MVQTIKLVFSNHQYIVLASVIFVSMLIPLSIVSEYIFLEPYIVAHLPSGSELGFVLIVIVSGLSGLVIAMNVFRIKALRNRSKKKLSSGVFGSIIGAAAGICSCGPIGFAVISTFGAAGGVATAFLTNYEIPIRLVAIAVLAFTYYTTTRSLAMECKIKS